MTDEDTFQVALAELVQEAEGNGVDVEDAWRDRDRTDDSELGIETYEVVRRMPIRLRLQGIIIPLSQQRRAVSSARPLGLINA